MKIDQLAKLIADLDPAQKAELEELLHELLPPETDPYQILPRRPNRQLPLSFSQRRLWFFDQYESGKPVYNIPAAFCLIGRLNISALEAALREIIARHEILRTTYDIQNDQPIQVIHPNPKFELEIDDLQHYEPEIREQTLRDLIQSIAYKPFDLTQSVFRCVLFYLEPDNHILLWVFHHIAIDGWSREIFNHELSNLYGGFSIGEDVKLPDLAIQYADFAIWQRDHLDGFVLEQQLEYWRSKLAGIRPLELPTDRIRPPSPSYHGQAVDFRLSKELVKNIKKISQENHCSLYMILLASFFVLLSRYTGQSDLFIGSPITNRRSGSVEKLIGFFVNNVVLRADLSGNPSYSTLLGQVREIVLAAHEHQDLPFEIAIKFGNDGHGFLLIDRSL